MSSGERRRDLKLTKTTFNPFPTVTGKFSVMIGTLLHAFGSCDRHCEPAIEISSL